MKDESEHWKVGLGPLYRYIGNLCYLHVANITSYPPFFLPTSKIFSDHSGPVVRYINAHFHSRKFSMDRKFSENIIVKSSMIYVQIAHYSSYTQLLIVSIAYRGTYIICVGQSHFTKFSFRGKFSWVEMALYAALQ
jgi:hypothetical protein